MDNVTRIPMDAKAWILIKRKWFEFKIESIYLRLGLAINDVNPIRMQSTSRRTWPVIVVNYNIPLWLIVRKGHFILSLIIPRKYKVKIVEIYMVALINELQI